MTPVQELQLRNALNPMTPSTTTQRTQYEPDKLQALKAALASPRQTMSGMEAFANALAQYPETRSFTGGFGEEIINPWAVGLSSLARGFGSAYGAKTADERAVANQAREDAIKAAELDNEAAKKVITDQVKYDERAAEKQEAKIKQAQQEALQKDAALSALHNLDELAKSGSITALNKSTDNWALSKESSRNIGKREQALSALIPLTNAVAKASGGSGINTLGEMMAYVGLPENATSAQIKGALPGIVKKLGLEEDYYQMSPVSNTNNGMAF